MIYFWGLPEDTLSGGGFRFLEALRAELTQQQVVATTPRHADAILVDSYHGLLPALAYKMHHPAVRFIFRFGPVFQLHRAWFWRFIDQLMILAANRFADLVIFQSQWSLQQAMQLGFNSSIAHTVIYNGVDPAIFYPAATKPAASKTRLIATSWSSNANKGFSFLTYLDEHLDWSKYELTFVGNSPVEFQQIKHLPALPPAQLAEQLRAHDIYIAGMRDDACSNALLEAAATGLPIVALDSGANPELMSPTDSLFTGIADLIPAVEQTRPSLHNHPKTIQASAAQYQQAIAELPIPRRRMLLWYYLGAVTLHTLFYVFQNISSHSPGQAA
jgi:glycosyltransferase involved in cell wall biosynthesis